MSVASRASTDHRKILVVDVGGSHVKILASGKDARRKFVSGPRLTAERMVERVQKLATGWRYDAVALGIPGPVLCDRPVAEPPNLGLGWVGFDYAAAFGHPVRIINDAAMQALGSYHGGKMLFLGLGTGLGSTLIIDGTIEAMELGHLPYKKKTYEDYVGRLGLEKHGWKKWRKHVDHVINHFIAAPQPEYVVIGGGNATQLKTLLPDCELGDNAAAFTGGFRLWEAKSQWARKASSGGSRPAHVATQSRAAPSRC